MCSSDLNVLGSAVFSGGVAAARGGTVAQILTAAATGGAANYLGQVATNAINSAKITNTRIDQGQFDDAVFAAADAKGLADQGLSKQAITNVLNSTGLNSQVAAEAAALATSGQTADQIAVALSNRFGGTTINGQKTLYTNGGDGVSNSVIGGANTKALESIQKVEDGILISQDAKNIYASNRSSNVSPSCVVLDKATFTIGLSNVFIHAGTTFSTATSYGTPIPDYQGNVLWSKARLGSGGVYQ